MYRLAPLEKGKDTMRRLFVPLTALGLLGIVIGCKSKDNYSDSHAPGGYGPHGGPPPVISTQPLPGGANGKVPDMPPTKDGEPKDGNPKDGNPKDKEKETESTVAPLKTPPRTAPF
jgi:hypothetical protein